MIQKLGGKISEIRKKKKLTNKKLAEMAGITPSLLSQIEKGTASPSLSTLQAIAEVLEVPIFSFFVPDDSGTNIQRAPNRVNYEFSAEDGKTHAKVLDCMWELLSPGNDYSIIMLKTTLSPNGGKTAKMNRHEGEEIAYISRGTAKVKIESDLYTLNEGDSIRILPQLSHQWFNDSNADAEIIMAIQRTNSDTVTSPQFGI